MIRNQYIGWLLGSFSIVLGLEVALLATFFPEINKTLLLFTLLLSCLLVLFYISQLFYKKLMAILTEQCDPQRYLIEYDKFYWLSAKSKLGLFHGINKSIGLCGLGQFEEAGSILNQIESQCYQKRWLWLASYLNNQAAVSLGLGDIGRAERYLAEFESLLQTHRALPVMLMALRFNQAAICFHNRHIAESQQMFYQVKPLIKNKISQLNFEFYQGLIHIELGEIQAAQACLTRVVNEGNTLYTVQLAQQKLAELNVQTSNE